MSIPPLPVLAAAGSGDRGLFDVFVGLHVVCAVIGFGAVALSGAYGAIGRRASGTGSTEDVRRFFASPNRAEYLLPVAPVFGVAAMAVRPGGSELGQAWAIIGFVIWVVASGLLLGIVRPAEAAIRARLGGAGSPHAGSPDAGSTGPGSPGLSIADVVGAAAGPAGAATVNESRLMWAAAACDLLFVVALLIMVMQPA